MAIWLNAATGAFYCDRCYSAYSAFVPVSQEGFQQLQSKSYRTGCFNCGQLLITSDECLHRLLDIQATTHIQGEVNKQLAEEVNKRLVTELANYPLADRITNEIRLAVQVRVDELFKSMGPVAKDLTESMTRDYVDRILKDKLRIDIRIDLVEPPNGVLRNVSSPEDHYYEQRET